LKFLRPLLEDKMGKLRGNLNKNFQLLLIKIQNLVLRVRMEFIEETLMEKYNVLLEWDIFPN